MECCLPRYVETEFSSHEPLLQPLRQAYDSADSAALGWHGGYCAGSDFAGDVVMVDAIFWLALFLLFLCSLMAGLAIRRAVIWWRR